MDHQLYFMLQDIIQKQDAITQYLNHISQDINEIKQAIYEPQIEQPEDYEDEQPNNNVKLTPKITKPDE